MVGIEKDYSRIIGINFFDNVETPGLGARITEDWFQAQFAGLTLERKDGRGRFFTLHRAGTRKAPEELDAVTGATQTSEAVGKFLNKELNRFVNEVVPLIGNEI
ncbi:MAG: FMN-binding protein [Candidatus Mariimomonas ferrooxydans]